MSTQQDAQNVRQGIGRWMLAGVVMSMLWLCGCARTAAPSPMAGTSEPPSATGVPIAPAQPTLTIPPTNSNDAPVSSGDTVTPGPSMTPPAVKPLPSAIIGRVMDANQQPIAEAVVLIVKGSVAFPERTWLTDNQGKYTIFISPGSFTVGVNAEGFKQAQQDVVVTANQQSVLDFILDKE